MEIVRALTRGFSEVDFRDFRDALADAVVFRLGIGAQGGGSGVNVRDAITQAWTVPEGRVTRLGTYARRRTALADLGRD